VTPICSVDWCDRPVVEGAVCSHCSSRLERALGDIPALTEELDTVLTKQARYAAADARRGERSLPFNPEASELGWVLRNTLATWCRLIGEERGKELPGNDTPPAMARWLLAHVEWLRHHRAGHEAIEEITSIVGKIRKIVDRPSERIYAGPCRDCGGDMYGKPGAASVECRPCGLVYDVADMVAWMQHEARQRLVTAKEAIALLGRFGLPLSQKTIEKWRQRDRLIAHPEPRDGVLLYKFDDIWKLRIGDDTPEERAS
jgi:hypothetical protein